MKLIWTTTLKKCFKCTERYTMIPVLKRNLLKTYMKEY